MHSEITSSGYIFCYYRLFLFATYQEEKDKSPLADPQLSNLSWLENVFVNSVSQNEIFTQKNENVEPEEKEGKGEENYNFSTFNLKAFSRLHSHNEGVSNFV